MDDYLSRLIAVPKDSEDWSRMEFHVFFIASHSLFSSFLHGCCSYTLHFEPVPLLLLECGPSEMRILALDSLRKLLYATLLKQLVHL
jgi:hypothetical protein